jgi:hypothetical protein
MNYKTDINEAAKSKLLKFGFAFWTNTNESKNTLLIPLKFWDKIPDGTKLKTIMGEIKIKGQSFIDLDTRGGYLAVGLLPEDYNKILQFIEEK